MRIVENSAARLVLQDRTCWISFVCWVAAPFIVLFGVTHHEPKAFGSAALSVIFGIAFFRSSTVVFDKASRSCIVKRLDMWRLSRTAVPFDAIEDVLIQPMLGDDSSTIACRLSLATRAGDILLSASYEPDLDRFEKMRSSLVDTIFDERSAPASADLVSALVAAGRRIDAIALLRSRERLGLVEANRRIDELQNELQTRHT